MQGTIDGSGQKWWIPAEEARQKKSGYTLPRPNLIVLTRVKNLTVRGVTIQNSPKFHFVPTDCENVLVEDAKFFAPERAPNTDAIDPSMCKNVTIRRCLIDVGDDNVAVKSGKPHPNREFAADTLLVDDCTFKHGHGMSIGSEMVGGVKDVVVRNCTFEDTDNGIRIKTDRKKGGPVVNLLCENITMKDVAGAITISLLLPQDSGHRSSRSRSPRPRPRTATSRFATSRPPAPRTRASSWACPRAPSRTCCSRM